MIRLTEAQARKLFGGTEVKPDKRGGAPRKASGAPLPANMPQDILWSMSRKRWGEQVAREFSGAVPGRRYRLDLAFPEHKIAIEVDGFRHHGKYLSDFRRDRVRQNLLVAHGWKVLRVPAGDLRRDPLGTLEELSQLLKMASGGLIT